MIDDKIEWHPKIVRSYLVQDTFNINIPNQYKYSFLQLKHPFLGNNDENNMKCKCKLIKDENNSKEIIDNINENNINNENENKYFNNEELDNNYYNQNQFPQQEEQHFPQNDNYGQENNEIIETLTQQLEENNKIIKSILQNQNNLNNYNNYNKYYQQPNQQYQSQLLITYQQIPQYQVSLYNIPQNQNIPNQFQPNINYQNQYQNVPYQNFEFTNENKDNNFKKSFKHKKNNLGKGKYEKKHKNHN